MIEDQRSQVVRCGCCQLYEELVCTGYHRERGKIWTESQMMSAENIKETVPVLRNVQQAGTSYLVL